MKQQIKKGQLVKVVKADDAFNGCVGEVTDNISRDGARWFCVRFGVGEISWYSASELASAQQPAADGDAAAGDVSDPAEQLKWARIAINEANKHIVSLQSELAAVRDALEPFAEAWLQVPLGVDSRLWIDRYVEGVIIGGESLGIDTSMLEDAHTAYFGLPAAADGREGGI